LRESAAQQLSDCLPTIERAGKFLSAGRVAVRLVGQSAAVFKGDIIFDKPTHLG
jgi:hypothetical protein